MLDLKMVMIVIRGVLFFYMNEQDTGCKRYDLSGF